MTDFDPEQLKNQIKMYYTCGLCFKEKPEGKSMEEWSANQVGASKIGIQVWCRRHECNVMHMDLEGHKHPAYTTRKPTETEKKNSDKEQPEQIDEEKLKELRCAKIMHTAQSHMEQAFGEFNTMLPVVLGLWLQKMTEGKSTVKKQIDLLDDLKLDTLEFIKENMNAESNSAELH